MSFKVGDWVTSKSWADTDRSPAQITNIEFATTPDEEHFVFLGEDCCVEMKYIQKWEPKEGEWCWFCEDPDNFPIGFVLDKFSRMSKYNSFETEHSNEYYDYCFPFIGELPYEA